MRFDMRAAPLGAPAADLYQAAIELSAWGEANGAANISMSEHHMSADGYLPSPMLLATAIAARTTTVPLTVAIVTLPLYNPVRLAEEMCVLDLIARGRARFFGGIGYVPAEYEMHGVDFHRRGAIADEYLSILTRGLKGEQFEHNGRRIHVTPRPYTPGGPKLGWGGGSLAAARRAGKYGLDFIGQRRDPALLAAYEEACTAHEHTPGMFRMPSREDAAVVFVAEDLDSAWTELGPYIMNDVLGYAQWHQPGSDANSISFAKTHEDLRAENRSHRILTVEEAVDFVRAGNVLPLHPLIGGLPPEIAWKYVRLVAEKVMPAVKPT